MEEGQLLTAGKWARFQAQDRAQGVSSPRDPTWRINWRRTRYPRPGVFRHTETYLFMRVDCVPGTGKGTLFSNKILHRNPLNEAEKKLKVLWRT